jgi:nitroreductase
MDCLAGKKSPETLDYLLRRRSVLAKASELKAPGPNAQELETILTAASRVPDHGKICPFYFLVFEGDARAEAGKIIAEAYAKNNPDCREGKVESEAERFMRSPMVIGVIHRARESKNPLWEQMLSTGAACQNLILAANALGYGTQWLTEWYAYDDNVRTGLGLDGRDVVAGFIYLGSVDEMTEDRDRPDLSEIVNYWEQGTALKKGDCYARTKFDVPELGFQIEPSE